MKSSTISIRVTPEEKSKLMHEASERGISLSKHVMSGTRSLRELLPFIAPDQEMIIKHDGIRDYSKSKEYIPSIYLHRKVEYNSLRMTATMLIFALEDET